MANTHESPPCVGVRSPGSPTSSAILAGFHVPCIPESTVNNVRVPNNRYRRTHQNPRRGDRTLGGAVPYPGGSDTVLRGKQGNDLTTPGGHNPRICGFVAATREFGSTSERYRTTGEDYRTMGEGLPYYGGNLPVPRGKDYRTTGEETPYHEGRFDSVSRLPMGIAVFDFYLLVLLSLLCLCFVNNRGRPIDTLATGRGTGGEAP